VSWRWPAVLAVFALLAATIAAPAAANTRSARDPDRPRVEGLSAKERNAINVTRATVRAARGGGLQVEARFKGNIEKALGRGKLSQATAAIVLRPRAGVRAGPSILATSGKGPVGKLDTTSRTVDVYRDGKRLVFTIVGPGAENVGSVAVKVFVKKPRSGASAAGDVSLFDLIAELKANEQLVIGGLTGEDACGVVEIMIEELDEEIDELREEIREARGRDQGGLAKEADRVRRARNRLRKFRDENCGQPVAGPVEIVFTLCSGPHGGATSPFDVDVEIREAGGSGARAATAIGAGASMTITLVPPNDGAVVGPNPQTKTLDGAGKGHFDFEINQFGDYTVQGSATLKDGRSVSGETTFNVGQDDPACTG
jgi:hypothetical protein